MMHALCDIMELADGSKTEQSSNRGNHLEQGQNATHCGYVEYQEPARQSWRHT